MHKLVTGRPGRLRSPPGGGRALRLPVAPRANTAWVENSHASTIVSYAHGLAVANDLSGNSSHQVVAVLATVHSPEAWPTRA
ncbi:MAG: 1-deoxy-D-xylulose-5-phosphate synthase N-terminal domain-containing protein [Microthrixaceae bacterium]